MPIQRDIVPRVSGAAVSGGGCPHVDRNDLRCGTRFSLGRIDQAFTVCFGSFHACPMYHRINAEVARGSDDAAPRPIVAITVSCGRARHAADDLPLRATGT